LTGSCRVCRVTPYFFFPCFSLTRPGSSLELPAGLGQGFKTMVHQFNVSFLFFEVFCLPKKKLILKNEFHDFIFILNYFIENKLENSYSIWRNICSSCHSIFMHPSSICRISLQIQQYLKYLVSELENTIYIYICVCVHSTMNWLKTTTQKHTMKAFGNTVQPAFSKNLKSFFFLLKFNMICTFWIVLMCWC